MRQKRLESEDGAADSPGPMKEEVGTEREGREKETTQRSSLMAMKKAVRNGDMFTEEGDIFAEKYLVSLFCIPLQVHVHLCIHVVPNFRGTKFS